MPLIEDRSRRSWRRAVSTRRTARPAAPAQRGLRAIAVAPERSGDQVDHDHPPATKLRSESSAAWLAWMLLRGGLDPVAALQRREGRVSSCARRPRRRTQRIVSRWRDLEAGRNVLTDGHDEGVRRRGGDSRTGHRESPSRGRGPYRRRGPPRRTPTRSSSSCATSPAPSISVTAGSPGVVDDDLPIIGRPQRPARQPSR